MLFSCKITHSIITYLDRRGEDLEVLYEKCDWPVEFLRDPASWLEADKMESVLRQIHQDFARRSYNEQDLMKVVGHQCKDLRSWGVLDSVLRMVQAPKDLFAQPERLLSYFVSPAPPVGEMRRGADSVSFVLPVSEVQFPLVTMYLGAALEALPTYINKPMANVRWENSRVTISWSENQESLFSGSQSTELSLHPELVRNILVNLETSQRQLEEMKGELHAKDVEIERLRREVEEQASAAKGKGVKVGVPAAEATTPVAEAKMPVGEAKTPMAEATTLNLSHRQMIAESAVRIINHIMSDIYRVGDYMARGQQLVTLLVGQGRQNPQVTEAMRRVDWSHVAIESPRIMKRAVSALQSLHELAIESKTDIKKADEMMKKLIEISHLVVEGKSEVPRASDQDALGADGSLTTQIEGRSGGYETNNKSDKPPTRLH